MIRLLAFSLIFLITSSCTQTNVSTKVLFVTTNVSQMNGEPNGTYLIELAVPFNLFVKNKIDIEIVSPKGGEIPIYHNGDTSSVVQAVVDSALFKAKTKNSLSPEEVRATEYSAVVIPGGYGQFWDTHKNTDLLEIIADVHEQGGVIGTIGHGTATLINVKLKSGDYLFKDKTLTSFPSWNEKNVMKQSNFGDLLPYDMEVELRKRGADLKVYDHEAKTNYEVVDAKNKLVTASFAGSGEFLAEEIIKLINSPN
ncbi:MAG: type 1 glutamine amidotransferase domain-containing protein [Gammaproteobacteria bacterium]